MTNQRKILVGFSLSLMVIITMLSAAALLLIVPLRPYAMFVCICVAGYGFFLLIWAASHRDSNSQQPATLPDPGANEHPLAFFSKSAYWGWILLLSAIPIYFVSQRICRPMVVQARTIPKPKPQVVEVASEPTNAPPEKVKFPRLVVRGVVCNGDHSTAVVNGSTVRVGERVERVRVVSIERWGIVAELEGCERFVTLQR